ncbi:hypothetical protein [Methylobacterium sp. WL8]|uniref:hypothetical protein n=1 Tax=Methylobacterium sp. WL8 TaxID=2603899 RepID=UPI0011CC503F|nr:hypothetical protein [Methylobacterium sp. WL8]TXN77959.1 hypothetical protein FV234_23240 [Methylobacterium sp. WL8]
MSASDGLPDGATSLHRNPFCVLGATTRDSRSRIIELAEERSLVGDEDACREAQNALINLRARLTAEIGWFPGVSPRKASEVVNGAASLSLTCAKGELPPLPRANALVSLLETMTPDKEPAKLASLLLALSEAVEEIELDDVLRDINEDRSVAGYQPVRNVDLVATEFELRKRTYLNAVRDLVDRLPSKVIVKLVDHLVDKSTNGGQRHAPPVIQDLVDVYETGAQEFIRRETENVQALLWRARAAIPHGEDSVSKVYEDVERAALSFNVVTKPIQIVSQANGVDHEPSSDLAFSIRHLALDLHNDHGWHVLPDRITAFLAANFPKLGNIQEKVAEDAEYLRSAAEERSRAQERNAEYERSLEYTAEIGLMFKDTVTINASGITWQKRRFPLDVITRLRWGGTRHSVNGIPTGTSRVIFVGDATSEFTIHLRNEAIYDNVVERLWKGVGFRLLVEHVARLKQTGSFPIPGGLIRDDGVTLTRRRMFGSNETVLLGWHEVNIWNGDGNFFIGKKDDRSVHSAMSYQGIDNTPVIENLIRAFFKSEKPRPSQLLD